MIGRPPECPQTIATELIDQMTAGGVVARLFGGAAIALAAAWNYTYGIPRSIRDLDLVVRRSSLRVAAQHLKAIGGTVDRRSLMINDGRLVKGSYRSINVDIYSDPLYLSHKISLGSRLDIDPLRLTTADLLATKLQIESGSRKDDDLRDIIALLASTPLSDNSDVNFLNKSRICSLCAQSWGFYYSTLRSFAAAEALLPSIHASEEIVRQATTGMSELKRSIERTPKSRLWKLRQHIGPRLPWYEAINS